VRLIVADEEGKLTAVVRDYVPIQTSLLRRKHKAKAAKNVARKHVEIVSTRTGEVLNPKPVVTQTEWTVESVIGSLNVRQAMAVYDELRKIFGA
jgi:hypothetical protein